MHKVAVVIPKYGLIGGAEQFVSELTGRLVSATGYDFHVCAHQWHPSSVPVTFHKAPIITFPKFLTTPSFAYFVRRTIRREKFSLVHSHERIFAADIFTMHGVPHRYWIHNIRRKRMNLFDTATAWVERKLVYEGNVKKFVAVSGLTKEIFLKEYEINPDQVAVIHPGVDLSDYAKLDKDRVRSSIRGELGIGINEPLIVFASMNFEIKGLDDILSSLARLKAMRKSFKLVVAGKGDIRKYEKIARDADIMSNVIFTGPVSKEKLIEIYLAGDIYIMLSRFDTFGMVVLEAMAAGLPVMISSHVGARDIVTEDENGFVIDNTSKTDYIAAKIAALLDNDQRRKMSAAAVQTAKKNTWTDVTKKYSALYESILAEKHGSHQKY